MTSSGRLDRLLQAHADALPERPGAGANHYPMAAEALETLGHERAIDDAWRRGAKGYMGELPRAGRLDSARDAFGGYERFGDLLDYFRSELSRSPWRAVIARWAPRLAPGISGAAFHGVIRTGHAARALRHRESAARRGELAVGLAYWASRYTELPAAGAPAGQRLEPTLQRLDYRWREDRADVDFFSVNDRLTRQPIAPPVDLALPGPDPRVELELLVRDAATAFLEMLVLERHRIWLLHTVTGPASAGLLLDHVDRAGARRLVEYARQAVVALYEAFGEPFTARAHIRQAPEDWPGLVERAVASQSVHTIKLTEALHRFDNRTDTLCRSVATQWLEWV